MIVNRLVTKKQKKFLEKTFACLDISIEDLMEINNLKEVIKQNKELQEQINVLNASNLVMAQTIEQMKQNITELIVQQQNDALEQLFKEYGTPSIENEAE